MDTMPKGPVVPVCLGCGHKHRTGAPCADHHWHDSCPYVGTNCPWWPEGVTRV